MARVSERRVNQGTERRVRYVSQVNISRGYVLFLTLISITTVFMCVEFLSMKSVVDSQNIENVSLRRELAGLKSENDALFEDIAGEVSLEDVKHTAMTIYNMNYAEEDQIVWYTSKDSGYVRQYISVPEY